MPKKSAADGSDNFQDNTPKNILLVEDGIDAARVLQMLLQSLGHTVAIARSGADAIRLFDSVKPDVVLLDISLPDMDGYAVARAIRNHPLGSRAILVAITGWGDAESQSLATSAGFDHHLLKPAPLDQLEAVIRSRSSRGGE